VASAKKQKANLFCIHDFLILIVREEYVSGVNKKLIYSSPTFFVYSALSIEIYICIFFFLAIHILCKNISYLLSHINFTQIRIAT